MIQSMTGFGRCELTDEGRKYVVEIKTVNHRYLDLSIKMPKKFNAFEADVRAVLKKYVKRGKVDLFLSYEDLEGHAGTVRYNSGVVSQYVKAMREMAEEFQIPFDLTAEKLARFPEVFSFEEEELDQERTLAALRNVVEGAAQELVATRSAEGRNLKVDLISKLDGLEVEIGYIEEKSPEIVRVYQQKLEEKLSSLLEETGMEQSRILAEVTLFADKTCVDEELVRLKSHVDSLRGILEEDDSIGRKLDFVVQEMNREANTILSKAGSVDLTDHGINVKTEIEKIREQVQNIE